MISDVMPCGCEGAGYSAPFLSMHTQPVELRFKGKALSVSARSYPSTGVGNLAGECRGESEVWQKREEGDKEVQQRRNR